MQVPLTAGKPFPIAQSDNPINYAIINESLARKLWPNQSAIGNTFYVKDPRMKETDPPRKLVVHGVSKDFHANGPIAKTNDAVFTQFYRGEGGMGMTFLLVRDHSGVPSFKSINDAVHRANPRMALYFPSTIKSQIELTLSPIRMTTDLTTVFSLSALILGIVGIYGLTVSELLQSRRELGIRLALGSPTGRLWLKFAGSHIATVLAGSLAGLVGASLVAQTIASLLHGVHPHHASAYLSITLLTLVISTLACLPSYFQLRKIDPIDCLRST
jgi:hypothetical protein